MISAAKLNELFDFDFANGRIFWKQRANAPQWNARYAGKEAFTSDSFGYKRGSIGGKLYLAHRVIFAAHHGYWPDLIDHINQDRSDNRISNLRAADKRLNANNSKVRRDSATGVRGVSYYKRKACWRAYINRDGRQIHLGFYPSLDAAVSAREAANSMEPR